MELHEANAALIQDNQKLIEYSNVIQCDLLHSQAQIAFLTEENKNQQAKLHTKEAKRKTAQERVNLGGRAIEATSDECMTVIEEVNQEKATAAAEKGAGKGRKGSTKNMSKVEVQHRRTLFQEAVKNWKSERERLKGLGRKMKEAGDEPCLWWFIDSQDPEDEVEGLQVVVNTEETAPPPQLHPWRVHR